MREIIVKVFGYFEEADENCLDELHRLCASWYLDESVFRLEDGGLHIYHEGEYFPHEDAAAVIARYIRENSQGKMDVIDYEAWTLKRYFFAMEYQRPQDLEKGIVYFRSSSLDHALEASQAKNSAVIMK